MSTKRLDLRTKIEEVNYLWRLKSEQKIIDIDGVKVGGIPGKNPSVLIGTIFYKNHKIVTDERRGLFIRSKAEELINIQEEFSD
ncbi:MAG: hypothetical protein ACFFFD_15130, partial [Promethearchaeota archaeon]